ncbi:MAG TPA: hypothetical protein VN377_02960 [Candidatus Thermoplasmatota archaeon]|nr:hypothetical protein [Candidatus Thermoplasmatota archaeon]
MGIVTKLELPKGLKELLDDLEEAEERNDVCIYKTLRYPPRSTPPATD